MPRPHVRVRFAATATLVVALTLTLSGGASAETHWAYEGEAGPEHWAELDEAYKLCADASRQSPIDIGHPTGARLPSLHYRFAEGGALISNNGHTVLAAANPTDPTATNPADSIVVGGTRYALLQMHFHAPSEHVVNGRHYPAEAHFVYRAGNGELSVVAVFLDRGHRTNRAWQPFVDALGTPAGTSRAITLDWERMLPDRRTTVRYAGSLTTPPCSEGVSWTVETTPVEVSRAQLAALRIVFDHPNNRPSQPVGKRRVLTDDRSLTRN